MDVQEDWWPNGRLGLTAPEASVLLGGPRRGAKEALKLAAMEAVGRGWLELAEIEGHGVFSVGEERSRSATRTAPRPLAAVLGLFDSASGRMGGGRDGLPLAKLAREARRRYGSPEGYAAEEVLPALEARGLYEKRERRFLGLFPRSRWGLTAAGERKREELERSRALGEGRFGGWVEGDPARAFLGLVGPLVLLMGSLYPELDRLREDEDEGEEGGVWPHPADPGVPAPGDPDAEDGSAGPTGWGEAGVLDLDPGAFDGLEGISSAIDSGFGGFGGGFFGLFGDGGGGGGFGGGDGGGGGGGF